MKNPTFLIFAAGASLSVSSASAALTFVDAQFQGANSNTTLADGTALNLVAGFGSTSTGVNANLVNPQDISLAASAANQSGGSTAPATTFWHVRDRPGTNGGEVLVAPAQFGGGAVNQDVPVLRTTITGLTPNAFYSVEGLFYTANAAWDIQFGLSEAALTTFDTTAAAALVSDFASPAPTVNDGGSIPLRRAVLGTSVEASSSGTIDIFINDGPATDRSWYEGVAYEFVSAPVPEPSSALLGLASLALLGTRRRRA